MVKVTTMEKSYSCLMTDGKHQILADTTVEKGGGDAGFRPHDLLASALGSCIAISLKMSAANRNIPVQSISVEVEIDSSIPKKTVFKKKIFIEGDISEEDRNILMSVANKCSVQRTLSRELEFVMVE